MVGSRAVLVGFIVKQMSISWISLINVIKRTGAGNKLELLDSVIACGASRWNQALNSPLDHPPK